MFLENLVHREAQTRFYEDNPSYPFFMHVTKGIPKGPVLHYPLGPYNVNPFVKERIVED